MLRTELSELKRSVRWLGFDHSDGKRGPGVWAYSLLIIFFVTNSAMYLVYKWDDIAKRVEGIKAFTQFMMFLSFLVALVFHWGDSIRLVEIADEGFFKFPYQNSVERCNMEHLIKNNMVQLNTIWHNGLFLFIAFQIVAPITIFIVRTIKNNIDNVETLYSPMPFYIPQNYRTPTVYLMLLVLQSAWLFPGIKNAYMTIGSALCSMQLLAGELTLLRLSVEEMEQTIGNNGKTSDHHKNDNDTDRMRKFLIYFLKHHQHIYRRADEIIKGIKLATFALNFGLILMLCTTIYDLVKRDEVIVKLQEAAYTCIVIFNMYCYSLMGNTITVEDENLRMALYQSPWVDKPLWFKKLLLNIMTRVNRPIEIKAKGMFALNIQEFVHTMKASYTFYNVLNKSQ